MSLFSDEGKRRSQIAWEGAQSASIHRMIDGLRAKPARPDLISATGGRAVSIVSDMDFLGVTPGSAQQWSAQEIAVLQRQAEVQRNKNPLAPINRLPEFKRKRPDDLTEKQIEWCRRWIPAFMPKVLP